MQITKAEVIPVELQLKESVRMAGLAPIDQVMAVFIRLETRQGQSAWGCTVGHPDLTGDTPAGLIQACRAGADLAPDLNPMNIEYALARIGALIGESPAALCAFDLAFFDLLGLAADLPLYKILGGYRNRLRTSITIPITSLEESLALADEYARRGFRIFKIKGGLDADGDVRRVKAIHQAYPSIELRLDADGGYSVQDALDVARALEGQLEMLEQPTPANDSFGLRQVTARSPVPILADQSIKGPASALELASQHAVNGMSIKLVACGGLQCARQVDAIARAARLVTMVSCFIEPALLIAAGLAFALSTPNVHYSDLDGHFNLVNDPSQAGFQVEEGWLVASDVPGLGYSVNLG